MNRQNLSVAYFGSPSFSAVLLENLLKHQVELGIKINLVVTQPDRPAGRGLMIQKTAVNKLAKEYSLVVYDKPLQGQISQVITIMDSSKIDLAIVFAFNEIIPKEMLSKIRYGFWNIHPSQLPKYRGSSPTAFPLIMGKTQTGVSLIQMNAKMDEGDIIDTESHNINNFDTQQTLLSSLTDKALGLIRNNLANVDQIVLKPQNNALATYTRKLTRQDGFVAWPMIVALIEGQSVPVDNFVPFIWFQKRNGEQIDTKTVTMANLYNLWCGLHPWPGIWTTVRINNRDTRLKIIEMRNDTRGIYITTIQIEGKRPTPFRLDQFQSAHESDS